MPSMICSVPLFFFQSSLTQATAPRKRQSFWTFLPKGTTDSFLLTSQVLGLGIVGVFVKHFSINEIDHLGLFFQKEKTGSSLLTSHVLGLDIVVKLLIFS